MAKPKVSPAFERRYLLPAELRRRMTMAEYGSDDVFWIRLAEREWRLLIQRDLGETPEENFDAFYNVVGQAIVEGGIGSASRFEKAREAVANAREDTGPDQISDSIIHDLREAGAGADEIGHAVQNKGYLREEELHTTIETNGWQTNRKLKLFCAWAKFCQEHGREPIQAEFKRFCVHGIYSEALLRRFRQQYRHKHRRDPSEEEKQDLLNKPPEVLFEYGFDDTSDFAATCRSLGLVFQDGNDRRKIRAKLRKLAATGSEETVDPLQLFENDPKLHKYFVENWSLGKFFEWLYDHHEIGTDIDAIEELCGMSLVFDHWKAHFMGWLEGMTSDGSVSNPSDRPLRDAFWTFCDRESFAPSPIETVVESTPEELIRMTANHAQPRVAKEALGGLRTGILDGLADGETVYNIPVCKVSAVHDAAKRIRIEAAHFSLDCFGLDFPSGA